MADLTGVPIIDVDSHVTEPPDLWRSRLPKRMHEDAPRVVWDERRKIERWMIGDHRLPGVAGNAVAGWKEFPPSFPPRLAEADPATWEAGARVRRLDEYGITAQVLYPNLLGFHNDLFMKMDPELGTSCVIAYNDFLTEFAAAAPERFILLTAIPFWDVGASVREIERNAAAGHRGLLLASSANLLRGGLPALADPYWQPILGLCQELGWSVNFHVGFTDSDDAQMEIMRIRDRATYAKEVAVNSRSCQEGIAELVMSGVCHAYPELKFVSVESGAGWFPFLMESMDWQWFNYGAAKDHPDREAPSSYIKRQVYGTFWYERSTIAHFLKAVGPNLMFETDFPHATSLSPGPNSTSLVPRRMAELSVEGLTPDQVASVMYGTAAGIYHVDVASLTGSETAQ